MDILLATHGRPDLLEDTLAHLVPALDLPRVQRIIVVENGGSFGASEICRRIGGGDRLIFLSTPIGNKSHALNVGLGYCASDLVFMTDDDSFVPREAVAAYSEWEPHGDGVYLGGPVKTDIEYQMPDWMKSHLPRSATGWEIDPSAFRGGEPLLGCNWAAFRSDLVRAGGFDPSLGPGSHTGATGQETNMQIRLRALGVRAKYLSNAVVIHKVPAERCNPEWIIQRAFRRGVSSGIRHSRDDLVLAEERLRSRRTRDFVKRMVLPLHPNESVRFRERFSRTWVKGFRHGVSLVKEGSLPSPPFFDFDAGQESASGR